MSKVMDNENGLDGSSFLLDHDPVEDIYNMTASMAARCTSTNSSASSSSAPKKQQKRKTKAKKKEGNNKKKWKKPKGMPKRPLSAYNLFFASERKKLMKNTEETSSNSSEGLNAGGKKMSFAGLARNIAAKWNSLDSKEKEYFEQKAEVEQRRYKKQVEEWKNSTKDQDNEEEDSVKQQPKPRRQQKKQKEEEETSKPCAKPDAAFASSNIGKCSTANLKTGEQALSGLLMGSTNSQFNQNSLLLHLQQHQLLLDQQQQLQQQQLNRKVESQILEPNNLSLTQNKSLTRNALHGLITKLYEELDEDEFNFVSSLGRC